MESSTSEKDVKKSVLLVSSVFPPQIGGRSEKVVSRAKLFARSGWQVNVLSPEIGANERQDPASIPDEPGITVHRTPYFFKSRWSSLRHDKDRKLEVEAGRLGRLPDIVHLHKGYVRWFPYAITRGVRLARESDVILTMSNPVAAHLIGLVISKWTGIPWVAEFRDPLVGYAYSMRGPEVLNRVLESRIIHSADHIFQFQDFVPEPIYDRYPGLPRSKFTVVPYAGYNPEDFENFNFDENIEVGDNKELRFSYTGTFYGETITPIPFFKGLKGFLSKEKRDIRAVFAGDWGEGYQQLVSDLGLGDSVEYMGYLTRSQCMRLWEKSHVLLLILGPEPDNVERIPSKFWDYLATGRPILALVHPSGKVARIVREQRLGFVADTGDPVSVSIALEAIWRAHAEGKLTPQPTDQFLASVDRTSIDKLIVDILEKTSRWHSD